MSTSMMPHVCGGPSPPNPTPLRVEPKPYESVRSLLLRTAVRNLCSSEEINGWLGLPAPLAPLSGDPGPAARLLGLEPDQFERMGFEDDKLGWVLGHQLPADRIYRTVRNYCPDCLAEDAYYRRIWDLQQLDVCPNHSRKLLDSCKDCGGQIRWTNLWSHNSCSCGARLDRPGLAPIVDDCSGARAIHLHCGMPVVGGHGQLPHYFSGFSLGSLLDLLFFLGRMDVVISRGNPDGIKPREMLTDSRLLNAGVQVALGWPDTFDVLANGVAAARPSGKGIMKQYGYLHRFIMRAEAEPYGQLLRDAYGAHLSRRGDISERSWPVGLGSPVQTIQALTLLEVQKALGLGTNAFRALRQQPLWTEIVPILSARNGSAQYACDDIEVLRGKLSRMVSPGVAARMLDFGRGRVALLIQAGLVPVHHWNRHHRNGEPRSVDLADLEALLSGIRKKAQRAAPTQPVTFDGVIAMANTRCGISYVDVFRCLVSGELRGHIAQPCEFGLGAFTFEKTEVEDILAKLASPAQIVLEKLQRRLRISARSIHQLVAEGFLPEPQRSCGFIFAVADVERFEEKFIHDVVLARHKQTRPDLIRRALRLLGVEPVTTIRTPSGGTSCFYRSEDVGPMLR